MLKKINVTMAVVMMLLASLFRQPNSTPDLPLVSELPNTHTDADQLGSVSVQMELNIGDQIWLDALLPSCGVDKEKRIYQVDDSSVAIVNGKGFLKAIGAGNTRISTTSCKKQLFIQLTVPAPPSLSFDSSYLPLTLGEHCRIPYTTTGRLDSAPIWSSSNPSVITVSANGEISAVSRGISWVTLQIGDCGATIPVWATDGSPLPPLTEIPKARFTNKDGILMNLQKHSSDAACLFLTGDIMALSAQQRAARLGETYNYNSSFDLVKPIFAQGDFVIGNLETCLSYSNPYTIQMKNLQGNPHCNAQSTILDALRYAGYDAVVTANNHCGDAGAVGILETVQMLDAYSIAHTGTFTQEDHPRYMLADVNGIRIAILSYTELINNKYENLAISDQDQQFVFNRYSEERAKQDVAAAKEDGAEFIIAYNHWGRENTHSVTDQQLEHAQQLADAGVDFIAGSHSHCLQPPALISAADGRQVPCIFSMGNFVSSMGRDINNDTVILKLNLRRDGDRIVLEQSEYIPCKVFASYEGGHHVIVPTSGEINDGQKNASAITQAEKRIDAVMGEEVFKKIQTPSLSYTA